MYVDLCSTCLRYAYSTPSHSRQCFYYLITCLVLEILSTAVCSRFEYFSRNAPTLAGLSLSLILQCMHYEYTCSNTKLKLSSVTC